MCTCQMHLSKTSTLQVIPMTEWRISVCVLLLAAPLCLHAVITTAWSRCTTQPTAVFTVYTHPGLYDSASDDYWQPYKANCSLVLSDYTQFATAIVRNHCFSDMHTVLAIRSVVQKLIQTLSRYPSIVPASQHCPGVCCPGIPALSRRLLLLSYLKKNGMYQEPEANVIGRRREVKRDWGTGKQRQVEVDNIFYYVPIENTLKLVLQQRQSWSLIDRRGEQACSGVVTDWLHGGNGLQLQDYCAATFPLSIPILCRSILTKWKQSIHLNQKRKYITWEHSILS